MAQNFSYVRWVSAEDLLYNNVSIVNSVISYTSNLWERDLVITIKKNMREWINKRQGLGEKLQTEDIICKQVSNKTSYTEFIAFIKWRKEETSHQRWFVEGK